MLPFQVSLTSSIRRLVPSPCLLYNRRHASGRLVGGLASWSRDAGDGAFAGTHTIRSGRSLHGIIGHAAGCRDSPSGGDPPSQPGHSNGDSISGPVHEKHGAGGASVCGPSARGQICRSGCGHRCGVPQGRVDVTGRRGGVRSLCRNLRSGADATGRILFPRQHAAGGF